MDGASVALASTSLRPSGYAPGVAIVMKGTVSKAFS